MGKSQIPTLTSGSETVSTNECIRNHVNYPDFTLDMVYTLEIKLRPLQNDRFTPSVTEDEQLLVTSGKRPK